MASKIIVTLETGFNLPTRSVDDAADAHRNYTDRVSWQCNVAIIRTGDKSQSPLTQRRKSKWIQRPFPGLVVSDVASLCLTHSRERTYLRCRQKLLHQHFESSVNVSLLGGIGFPQNLKTVKFIPWSGVNFVLILSLLWTTTSGAMSILGHVHVGEKAWCTNLDELWL